MFRTILRAKITNKFFNKLFLAYSLIIIVTISVLISIVSGSIASMIKDQQIKYNKQVLETVNTFFEQKHRNLKQLIQYILNDETLYPAIIQLLETNQADNPGAYFSLFKQVESTLSGIALSFDPDIRNLYAYNMNDSVPYVFYNKPSLPAVFNVEPDAIKPIKNSIAFIHLFPPLNSYTHAKDSSSLEFSTSDFIRDKTDISKLLGTLIVDYNSDAIQKSYAQYSQNLKGNILLLTGSGEVLFDSSGQYYGAPYPDFAEVADSTSHTFTLNNKIINVNSNSSFDFVTVGEIPHSELYKDIYAMNRKIYVVAAAGIVVILLLTYFSNIFFAKRIKKIIAAIKSTKNGNFNLNLAVKTPEDEFAMIAASLNEMGQRINEHIEKEYVYEIQRKEASLKQKEAELYTLQSQVNPHFLYNTLEVIRMKALTYKQNEVSTMIRILSELFRTSIKERMVVDVRDEIDYCQDYLELYKLRYGDTLKVEFDIDEDILDYGIIKHLLQPVVENTLVHGLLLDWDSSNVNLIRIRGSRDGDDIVIVISDNGAGMSDDKLLELKESLNKPGISTGKIGLSNVHRRIGLFYGDGYGLDIRSHHGEGTTVTLRVQAISRSELETHV
ncbi:sensor histidine kinase [Cohnella soli]|uniref:Sensor histidine kinase n=1 Tax=Cohnella soli TaxID=425005 RepID=A0ABW0HZS6_9BACL